MIHAQLEPRQLDEPLRVVALVRVSLPTDGAAVQARLAELAESIRAIYDWTLEFYFLTHEGDRRTPAEQAIWLLGPGGWEVLVVEDLTRICRDPQEAGEFVQRCIDAGGRVISLAEGFDSDGYSLVFNEMTALLNADLSTPDCERSHGGDAC